MHKKPFQIKTSKEIAFRWK